MKRVFAAREIDNTDAMNDVLAYLLENVVKREAEYCFPRKLQARLSASDIAMKALDYIWKSLDKFRGTTTGALHVWAKQIVRGQISDHFRAHFRTARRDMSLEACSEEAERGLASLPANGPSASRVLMEQEAIMMCLFELPEEERDVMILIRMYGWTREEVSQHLCLSSETVESLEASALERLYQRRKKNRKKRS